jgi:hypothetical protein
MQGSGAFALRAELVTQSFGPCLVAREVGNPLPSLSTEIPCGVTITPLPKLAHLAGVAIELEDRVDGGIVAPTGPTGRVRSRSARSLQMPCLGSTSRPGDVLPRDPRTPQLRHLRCGIGQSFAGDRIGHLRLRDNVRESGCRTRSAGRRRTRRMWRTDPAWSMLPRVSITTRTGAAHGSSIDHDHRAKQ